jgi:hypothetical protein
MKTIFLMKCDALALIEGKILMSRGSAHKIGMIAGLSSFTGYFIELT